MEPQAHINLTEILSFFTAFLLNLYHWTDSIYPFSDFNISLFWLFESTLLTRLVWQFFPSEISEDFNVSRNDDPSVDFGLESDARYIDDYWEDE